MVQSFNGTSQSPHIVFRHVIYDGIFLECSEEIISIFSTRGVILRQTTCLPAFYSLTALGLVERKEQSIFSAPLVKVDKPISGVRARYWFFFG